MRQILVDYSRIKRSLKRGGLAERIDSELVSDSAILAANIRDPETLLDLDESLTRLAKKDPRQAQLVELRYFGGLTEEEVADVLNISLRTVKREWSAARAWLFAEMTPSPVRRQRD
jgi:RNA polymerase sigma-70 factor (ECF subfamily)